MVETRAGAETSPTVDRDAMPQGSGSKRSAKEGGATGVTATSGPAFHRTVGMGATPSQQMYTLLAVALAGAALPLMFMPKLASRFMFGSAADPPEDQHTHLLQLNAGGLLAAACTALGLEEAARTHQLHTFTADALKLALVAFAAGNMVTQLYYPATLTAAACLAATIAHAAVFAIPASQLALAPDDRARVTRDFRRLPRNIPRFFSLRRASVRGALYMLLAVAFPLAGASYFLAPKFTLYHTFGYVYGKSTQWLWKIAGLADMTIMATLTAMLKDKSESRALARPAARTMNLGLLVAALAHMLVLGPILSVGHGGWMLPALVGTWGLALVAAMAGLASPRLETLVEETAEAAKTE